MKSESGLKLAYLCAVLNAVIIGFSFLFTKVALEHANPVDTLTHRFAVSFVVMSIPVAFGWVKFKFRGKLLALLLLATMYPVGFFLFQAFGLQHASSAEGGILYAFTPIVTMVLASVFLKEVTTLFQKVSIFLSVSGVVLIFVMKGTDFDFSNFTGIFLLVMSSLAFAGYSVLVRSLLRVYSPTEISYVMLGIGFVSFSAVSITTHVAAGTLDLLLAPLTSGSFVVSILYLGVLSSLVTALTANYALSKIEASRMSVFANLGTVVSIIAGAIFLGEEITVHHLIGSALIIAGVIGANRLGRKKVTA
ncbi:EamA-like transporter family protein [Laceyella tengchongensis]|uniref:EamA-like transporter family protein n=1 Tax=Laceyella tengchongensis TaxID=574699 RepID=A0AA45WNX4_9BACL|nr:DMT family transporter [Laceyella tengchongensis]SMP19089.1 EamA-like transporter family protein [Laceyella tengchongensis]